MNQVGDGFFNTDGPGESGAIGARNVGPDGKILGASDMLASRNIKSTFKDDGRKRTNVFSKKKGEAIAVATSGGPEPKEIARVVKKGSGAIKTCVEQAAKAGVKVKGKKKLLMIVSPRGKVKKTRMLDSLTQASPLGECITRAARKWKFTPFGGDEVELVIPLLLTTG